MQEFILKIAKTDKNSLGDIRCFPNIKAAVQEDWIWLSGFPIGQKLALKVQQLPILQTFQLDQQGRLFPLNALTPVGQLPQLNWQFLHQFLELSIPVAALAARIKKKYKIRFMQAKEEQISAALLTDVKTWKNYANSTATIRLQRLKFAASIGGQVLILGKPLPTLPGQTFWLNNNIFLPSGLDFNPPILSSLIAQKKDLSGNAFLLFDENGTCEAIDLEDFVPAYRSAVRRLGRTNG